MKTISLDDIYKLNIDKSDFYQWTKEALSLKKECVLPAKISMKTFEGVGFVNVMPTIIPSLNAYGVKVVSRNPYSVPKLKSSLMLFDLKESELLSVMDADYITAFRTGACATLAIETLAVKNYKIIGLIGLGNICRATLLVLLAVVKRDITLKLYLYKNRDNGIIDLVKDYKNVKIELYDNVKDTIVGSDVVVSCVTYASEDMAEPEWFKPGALLVPVHTRGFMNCDEPFDRVIIDDYNHTCGFKNFAKFKNCHELSDVLNDKSLGRQNDSERIIAYNIGIALLDIYFAKKIYGLSGKIKEIANLENDLPTFWVK